MRTTYSLGVVLLLLTPLSGAAHASSWIVAGEPYLGASADLHTINEAGGGLGRNRAVVTRSGVARNLMILPSAQPTVGALISACLVVDGVTTSLCATYSAANWPNATTSATVRDLAAGNVVSVRLRELNGVDSGANVRASFEISPKTIFSDGFESNGTTAWPGPGPSLGTMYVAGEPFVGAGFVTYSIGGSSGDLERNRAAVPRDGTLWSLYILPDQEPAASGAIEACLVVDGVVTALCETYTSAHWPNPRGNCCGFAYGVTAGDLVSVRVRETGTGSNVNVRASFHLLPQVAEPAGAMIVGGEPFLVGSGNLYTISPGASGVHERNRAPAPRAGTIKNLFLMPNLQPAVGANVRACIAVNGVDTALCTEYDSADWPNPTSNTATSIAVAARDHVSIHLVELNGVTSGANFRPSFELQ